MYQQHTLRLTSVLYFSMICFFPNITLASKVTSKIDAEAGVLEATSLPSVISAKQLFTQATGLIREGKIKRGLDLLHKAAKQGHLKAILELASFYELGLGVTKDYATAVSYYEQAIKIGSADARFNLALLLVNADTSIKDLEKARLLMLSLAKQGDAEAQYSLAVMYKEEGGNTSADLVNSLHWLRLAAKAGHADAEFNLGLHYLRGEQVDKNITQAFVWFKKAANKDMPRAQFNLALMYEKGLGTTVDAKQSIQWYKSAATLGNADAQQNLGIKYLLGDELEKNEVKALTLITKAARQQHKEAQFLLARIYHKGSDHIEADANVAEELYLLSAKQGHREAQYQLALMLSQKKGAEIDAKYWAYQATFSGHKKAYLLQAKL